MTGCAAAFGRAPLEPGCMVVHKGRERGKLFPLLSVGSADICNLGSPEQK